MILKKLIKNEALQTILTIVLLAVSSWLILLIFPDMGKNINKAFMKLVSKFSIFNSWISLLQKSLSINANGNIDIASPEGVLADIASSSSFVVIISGFLDVTSKSILESIITGTCSAVCKDLIQRWTLLCNALGIAVGLLISSALPTLIKGQTNTLTGLAYALADIVVLVVGICILCFSTNFYNKNRGHKIKRTYSNSISRLIKGLLWGIITTVSTTLFVTSLSLTMARIVSTTCLIIATLVHLVVSLLDCMRTRYYELRGKNTKGVNSWLDVFNH